MQLVLVTAHACTLIVQTAQIPEVFRVPIPQLHELNRAPTGLTLERITSGKGSPLLLWHSNPSNTALLGAETGLPIQGLAMQP